MIPANIRQPLWIPLEDIPKDLLPDEPLEEDALAELYRQANEATLAEVEVLEVPVDETL